MNKIFNEKYFNEKGFVYLHSPIITGSDAEGEGAMLRVTTLDYKNLPKTEEAEIVTTNQIGLLPVIQYRIEF